MLTPVLLATHVLVHEATASLPIVSSPIQDAVLVVRDPLTGNGQADGMWVTTPISDGISRPVSLAELRESARRTRASIDRPAVAFTVDQTIGGRPKHSKDVQAPDGGDGGVAGIAGSGFDLVFDITLTSVIPSSVQGPLMAALAEVEAYFESQIRSPVVVRVRFAYVPLAAGRLGTTSIRYSPKLTIDTVTALNFAENGGLNELDADGVQSVPVTSSLAVRYSGVNVEVSPENRVFITQALQKGLGLHSGSGIGSLDYDGVLTFNNTIFWDFDPSDGLLHTSGARYSFQDLLIRELMQVFGMVAGCDFLTRDCTVMDLFRFQSDLMLQPALEPPSTPAGILVGIPDIFLGAPFDDPDDPLPPPPRECSEVDLALRTALEAGGHFALPGEPSTFHALDYNPGLHKDLIARASELDPPLDADGLMAVATGPNPDDFVPALVYLIDQMRGRLDENGVPMLPEDGNVFDDRRFDTFSPLTPFPDGATQTVVEIDSLATVPPTAICGMIDFRQGEYDFGGGNTPVVQFRGACPRLVARNSPSDRVHLNFLQDTARLPSDFEISVFDGSPIRGCFISQNEAAPLATRCLMGKTFQKGVTWYSRDADATPPYSAPLGDLPDFLTQREWLILDAMGWAILGYNEGVPDCIDLTAE